MDMKTTGLSLGLAVLLCLIHTGTSKYVDEGNPYSTGKLAVSKKAVTESGDKSPLHSIVVFPTAPASDTYPVIFFVAGLNGYVLAEWYTEYMELVARHGFFVIGVDYAYPVLHDTPSGNLHQDINKFFSELSFMKTYLQDNPMLAGSVPDWGRTGLLCHSSGCDVTLRMIRQNHLPFSASVFLEPASILSVEPINYTVPALMYGTELSEVGPHYCSVKGVDYNQFYKIWKCPRIVIKVAKFGHCDILDPLPYEACHLGKFCTTTNDTVLPEYHQFVQGATASFFITALQGRKDAINYIADPSKSPQKLLEDISDLNC